MKFQLGANYWSRAGGPRMWERYDEAVVAGELAAARQMGLSVLRAFAFVPHFMPAPPTVEPAMLARLRQFGEAATAADVRLLFSPLVGHMSGDNFDFPERQGRSLWSDPTMLQWQQALVAATAEALHDSPALWGLALSNEMPLWAGAGSAAERGGWCATLAATARAHAPGVPVGGGDGGGGAWPVRAMLPSVDFLGPHVYGGDVDPLRQAFAVDAALAAARPWGKPTWLEEFGASATQAGPAEQAAYARESILAAWAAGADGALWWCLSDFDPATLGLETPYVHHAFELGFGLLDSDGRRKPVGDEMLALSRLFAEVDLSTARPATARAALVRPSYLDEDVPFSWQDREAMERTLRQAFVLCEQAGLGVVIVDEEAPLDDYRLVLCPSTQKLRTPTWQRLQAAASAGAVVYWSWCSGDHTFHQGAWCPSFERLTGLRHRLRYGCFDPPVPRLQLRGQVTLDIPTQIEHALAPASLSRLPIELDGELEGGLDDGLDGGLHREPAVEVWARDGDGRPALTSRRLGAGQVVFSPYPIERYLAQLADGSSRNAHRLYRLLGDEAGLAAPIPTRHPDVQARLLGDRWLVVQHRGWADAVDDAVDVPRSASLLFDRGNPDRSCLGPKGARVWRL